MKTACRGQWQSLALLLALSLSIPAQAFKNGQHEEASKQAANAAGAEAPDIEKFKSQIIKWSFGVSGTPEFLLGAAPAEQLAHSGSQLTPMGEVGNNNGRFRGFFADANRTYLNQNFASELPGAEGAYVLMGTSLHLIEDQASFPHGANILHSQEWWKILDSWETFAVEVGLTRVSGAQAAPIDAYDASLLQTQDQIPYLYSATQTEVINGNTVPRRYWLFNDDLFRRGVAGKSETRYAGEYLAVNKGIDPPFLGENGGENSANIYVHDENGGTAGLYRQQGTQAADYAYNFLLEMSKSFRPIVSGVTIGGTVGPINTVDGSPLRFKVIENRNSEIDIKAFIQETDQAIISDNAVRRIALGRGVNGSAGETQMSSPSTWDLLHTTLFGTKVDDMTLLPFEADFELTWKGQVVGLPLADGTYHLCVTARDQDLNFSPGAAESRTDTCTSFSVGSSTGPPPPPPGSGFVCAAKTILALGQGGTLERQGFDASLSVTNDSADALTAMSVTLRYVDAQGQVRNDLFAAKLQGLEGIPALDGSAGAILAAGATGKARWLIVPAPGAGGTDIAGQEYTVQAVVSYKAGTQSSQLPTWPAPIRVFPQPSLRLDYALPKDVTAGEPFSLALRVVNDGAGAATKLAITSAVPKILGATGKAAIFQILSSKVNGQASPETLKVQFPTLAPGEAALAEWVMTSDVTGRFTSLDASFNHAAPLGGLATSPIASVRTSILEQPVNIGGTDALNDYFVDSDADGLPDTILNSIGLDLLVLVKSGAITSPPDPLTGLMTVLDPPATGWALTYVDLPPGATSARPVEAVRSDGVPLQR